jgi:hypothetical protein
MSKIKYLSYILLILSTILFVYIFVISGNMTLANYGTNPDSGAFISLDVFLFWAYVLTGVAALLSVGFSIYNMIRNPKHIKKTLVTWGIMIALVVVAFAAASTDPLPTTLATEPTDFELKITGAGLLATYALVVVAVGAIIGGGIKNLIKNR